MPGSVSASNFHLGIPLLAALSVISILVNAGILILLVLNLVNIKKVSKHHILWLVGIIVVHIGGSILVTFIEEPFFGILTGAYTGLILRLLLTLGVGAVTIWRLVDIVKAGKTNDSQRQSSE